MAVKDSPIVVRTTADLAGINPAHGEIVETLGHTNVGVGAGRYEYQRTGRSGASGLGHVNHAGGGADDWFRLVHDGEISSAQAGSISGEDAADSIQACVDVAGSTGVAVRIPASFPVLINSTISVPPNVSIKGDGAADVGSLVLTEIDDGSPVFDCPSGSGYQFQDFTIKSATGSKLNCVGIRGGNIGDVETAAARFFMSNIRMQKLGVGIQWNGWIGTCIRAFIDFCDIGIEVDNANGTYWDVHVENCTQQMVVRGGNDVTIKGMLESGLSSTTHGIVVEAGESITLIEPYFEFNGTPALVNAISVGQASGTVQRFSCLGGTVTVHENDGSSSAVLIDKCNSGTVDGLSVWTESTVTTNGFELTANAIDVDHDLHRTSRCVVVDNGRSSGPVVNLVDDANLSTGEGVALTYAFNTRGYRSKESEVANPITFTVPSPANDLLIVSAHPLVNGNPVQLTTTGTLPAPLATATTYYVVSAAIDSVKLAATVGGSAIDITDGGSGTHSIVPQITPNIKHGSDAIRCRAVTTGNTLHRVAFDFPTRVSSLLAGKPFTFGCWVYVPSIANFVNNSDTVVATVDDSTDVFTSAGHGLSNGDVINFASTGTLPSPITVLTNYFVIDATADTFKVSLSSGGAAVNVTTAGTGVLYWNAVPLLRPAVYLYDGVASFVTNSGDQGYVLRPGGWQYMSIQGVLSSGATGLQLRVDIVGSAPGAGVSDGSEYLILDSVYIAEGRHSMRRMIDSKSFKQSRQQLGATAPTSGAHYVGEIVYNTAPSAAGTIGWVCVTAGTPGTWKTFGAIEA